MNRAYHKEKAKKLIRGNYSAAAIVTSIPLAVYVLAFITSFLGFTSVSSSLTLVEILLMPIIATVTVMYIKGKDFVVKDEMNKDLDKNVGRYFGTMGLVYLYTFLWSLLFIIPGIVKSYSYYLVPYILSDNPELSYNDAITESRRLMKGRKFDMFVFDFSFFWWFLLTGLSMGIVGLYLIPYIYLARAGMYLEIKNADLIEKGLQPEPIYPEETETVVVEKQTYKEEPYTMEEVEIKKDSSTEVDYDENGFEVNPNEKVISETEEETDILIDVVEVDGVVVKEEVVDVVEPTETVEPLDTSLDSDTQEDADDLKK